jgi:HSP20 family protein
MMALDSWFPFIDVAKTLDEMDRVFNRVGRPLGLRSVPRGTFPAINIYADDPALVLVAEMPGVEASELDLTVLNDTVTLKGSRRGEGSGNGARFYRRERPVGDFNRTVTLPEAVDPDSVQADYKDGVLTVRMEKAASAKARKIEIKS